MTGWSWDYAAIHAPIVTAAMAILAFFGVIISICVQRRTAQTRAAIDFFLRTETDEKMLEAHRKYRDGVAVLHTSPNIAAFAQTDDCRSVRSYLNVHELLAVGVNRHAIHYSVARDFWINELERACRDCNRLLLHLEGDRAEEKTYWEMKALNRKWQRGW
jgi:hypothetical protein